MTNACPSCGKKYSLPEGSIGRAFVCKRCGQKLQITEHGLSPPRLPPPALPPPAPAVPIPPPPAPIAAPPLPEQQFAVLHDDDENEDELSPRQRSRPQDSLLLDYLLLRRHITPKLIVIFFWAGTAVMVLFGFSTVISSFNALKGLSLSGGGSDLGGLLGDNAGLGGGFALPGLTQERGFSPSMFIYGLMQLVFGPIVLRVMCEFVIVLLSINETLLDMKERLSRNRR